MTTRVYDVVGAGGTGSLLFPPLLRYLASYHDNRDENYIVSVLDGDHVEPHNLERQMFAGRYVDENKARALVELYGHEETTVAIPEFVGDDNVTNRIRSGDIVLIAADNFDVRARIERHGFTLPDLTVINGGNETLDGSLQIWLRRDGQNITPPLSWMHDEILRPSPYDPSRIDCEARMKQPGGEQTIVANLMSATQMLNALVQVHAWENGGPALWHEVQFDLRTGNAKAFDWRTVEGWDAYAPEPTQAVA